MDEVRPSVVTAWPFMTIEEYDNHAKAVAECYAKLRGLHESWMSAYDSAIRNRDATSGKS